MTGLELGIVVLAAIVLISLGVALRVLTRQDRRHRLHLGGVMTQFRTPVYLFTDGSVDEADERTLVVLKLLCEYGFVVEAGPVETINED